MLNATPEFPEIGASLSLSLSLSVARLRRMSKSFRKHQPLPLALWFMQTVITKDHHIPTPKQIRSSNPLSDTESFPNAAQPQC